MGICMSKHSKVIACENEILKNKMYLYVKEISTLRMELQQLHNEKHSLNEISNEKIIAYRDSIQQLQTQLSSKIEL